MKQKIYLLLLMLFVVLTAVYLSRVEKYQTSYLPPKEPDIIFRNVGWQDQMISEGENRLYRLSIPTEKATITERTENSITVKWDRWGTELFVKQDDGTYLIQK